MSTPTTKEHILQIASTLFAANGFDKTSIRDIAKEADVNISAINYHFKSKAGLYSEVLDMNMINARMEIIKLAENITCTEELAVKIFNYLMSERNTFYNSMKLFLVNNLPLDKDILPKSCLNVPKGPPGTETLIEVIKKDLDFKGDEENLLWAARNIFHNIIIITLVSQSSFLRLMKENVCNFSDEEKIDSIRKNVRSTLNFIR